MSTDFELLTLAPPHPQDAHGGLSARIDRVLHTADDRPDVATLPPLADPAADHGRDDPDGRRADVEEKHQRVIAWLEAHGYDALMLGRADSIAWFTCGGEMSQDLCSERASVLLYINRQSRAVVCDNVQSARVFEEEVAGLGFQLKERPWYDAPERLVGELGHNRRVATDLYLPPWPNERERIRALRLTLSERERQLLRVLGRTVTHAVEATCRNFMPGEHEADVAGHLAHRLIREGVVPVDLRVASENRLERFRQPTFKAAPIHQRATIAVVGRRHGLCVGATRTVAFGEVDPAIQAAHNVAAMVDATCIFFSRPGETVLGVYRRAKRIYEKFGHADEWTLDYQGSLTGYAPCEGLMLPDSSFEFGPDMAVRWSPSVGPTRSEDTVVIDRRGFEVVTEAQNWPKYEVLVKGFPLNRPGILERPLRG